MGFISISIFDLLDVVIVSVLMSQLYKLVRGTSAYYIFMGIFLMYILWIVVRLLNMELISSILGQVLGVGVIALIVVFQQEVRRFLLYIGNKYLIKRGKFISSADNSKFFDELVLACDSMSESYTGALIVIEKSSDLGFVKETGDKIDAITTQRLIESVFYKNSPLHDGAMVVADGRIAYARCLLPTTENKNIPAYYGMRHRAALGLSETTDAVVVVVSEQSGKISFVSGGRIERGISLIKLKELLVKNIK